MSERLNKPRSGAPLGGLAHRTPPEGKQSSRRFAGGRFPLIAPTPRSPGLFLGRIPLTRTARGRILATSIHCSPTGHRNDEDLLSFRETFHPRRLQGNLDLGAVGLGGAHSPRSPAPGGDGARPSGDPEPSWDSMLTYSDMMLF